MTPGLRALAALAFPEERDTEPPSCEATAVSQRFPSPPSTPQIERTWIDDADGIAHLVRCQWEPGT